VTYNKFKTPPPPPPKEKEKEKTSLAYKRYRRNKKFMKGILVK